MYLTGQPPKQPEKLRRKGLGRRQTSPAILSEFSIPFISGDVYLKTGYRNNHPLAIDRIGPVLSLCEQLDWIDRNDSSTYVESPAAGLEILTRFHDPDYVNAIIQVENSGIVPREIREKYNIGTMENPMFEGLFQRASTSVGGSIKATELSLDSGIAYHPAGGTHHGQRNQASGFCYFNDPVFAILKYLELGFNQCLYVDLDAHHGDGVEAAFRGSEQVFCISIHEENRWPYTGGLDDRSSGNARNLAVPKKMNDSEFGFLVDTVLAEFQDRLKPDCMVITCGADALSGDPLSTMCLSNQALWRAVESLIKIDVPTVVLGGGGYNPWTVTRCWAGLWGTLRSFEIPTILPSEAKKLLASLTCELVDEEDVDPFWLETLADEPNEGEIRREFSRIRDKILKG